MTPSPLDLPILISQLPYVQKVVHAEQAKPEAHQSLFAPLLHRKMREEKETVQQVEQSEAADPVDRDGGGQSRGQPQEQYRERAPASEQEALASNASPWTGNIINVKI
ncbi:hypothetical protein [Desulfovibrio aminophilus]|uniref:hypothetical protein n=1 Tax=Desulfovibrio aminophilus TaxID=81425 RepID=UPI0033971281